MFPKILKWVGAAACIILIISLFLPWGYYADLKQHFTGFYSYRNEYGRPGVLLLPLASIALLLIILPQVWAKRVNLFVTAFMVGYAIKSYVLFTSCYNAYCPEKKEGIYLMIFSTVVILIASIFPQLKRFH